jgi:NTE family protein
MEGGGMLAPALAGYTYALEQLGIRFLRIGGASGGSINALFLAALGDASEMKTEKVLTEIADYDFLNLLDGNRASRTVVESIIERRGWLAAGMAAVKAWDTLEEELGLMPGDNLYGWFADVLARAGIETTRQLDERMWPSNAGLRLRDGTPLDRRSIKPALAVVATDLTTQSRVVLPRMASLYWEDPANINPALYVRASVSIPLFFRPLVVSDIPTGPEAEKRWKRQAGYIGPIPSSCTLVDGGVTSNFPVDLFHVGTGTPRSPTFGVKLGVDRQQFVDKPLNLLGAVFNSARNSLDQEFIARNPDYRRLVANIDTRPHDWLNFSLGPDERRDLFMKGAQTASDFLTGFDWEDYKRVRKELAKTSIL